MRDVVEAALDLELDLCAIHNGRHGDHKPAASRVNHLIVVQSSCRMEYTDDLNLVAKGSYLINFWPIHPILGASCNTFYFLVSGSLSNL